jgi:uncharacterized cupin superfamily protein
MDDMLLSDTDYFYTRAFWQPSFVLWPRRCILTGRLLFLEVAYKGIAMYNGPGDSIYEYHWHSANEHLLWILSQPVK